MQHHNVNYSARCTRMLTALADIVPPDSWECDGEHVSIHDGPPPTIGDQAPADADEWWVPSADDRTAHDAAVAAWQADAEVWTVDAAADCLAIPKRAGGRVPRREVGPVQTGTFSLAAATGRDPIHEAHLFRAMPTTTIATDLPEPVADWLERLVFEPKKEYAERYVRSKLGACSTPPDPGTDWARKARARADRLIRKAA